MKRVSILFLIVSVVLITLLSCSPKAAPSSPSNAPPKQAAPTTAAPVPDASAAEWAKVEEAARKEGKILAFTWGLTGTPGDKIVAFFKDKYGIEIERVTGVTSTLIERIKTDHAAGRYVADWFDASPSSNYALKLAGATEPIADLLPAIKDKSVFYTTPQWEADGQLVTTNLSGFTIAYNTKLVLPGQEPKSWRELTESKWAGKMVLASPTTAPDFIYTYVLKEKLNLNDDYFIQMGKQAKVVPTGRDAAGMLSRGEAHLWIGASSIMAAAMVQEGAPIKFVIPQEGPIQSGGTTMVKIKNAPHPNATRFFMNWLFTLEGQKFVNEAKGTAPLRKDVLDPTPKDVSIPWEKASKISFDDILKITKMQSEKTLSKMMGVN